MYNGCLLKLNKHQLIPNGLPPTIVSWEDVIEDTGGFFNPALPKRLTIPAGVSRVRIICSCVWLINYVGCRQMLPKKNGWFLYGLPVMNYMANNVTTTDMTNSSYPIPVVEGDYFEYEVFQSSGAPLYLAMSPGTWFGLEGV